MSKIRALLLATPAVTAVHSQALVRRSRQLVSSMLTVACCRT